MKSRYKRVEVDGEVYLEHRYVVEKHIGRKLSPQEQIHHINKDRYDNRIENLQIVTQAEHDMIHKWKYPQTKTCVICGREYKPSPTKRERSKVCSKECKIALDCVHAAKKEEANISIYT